MTQNSVGNVSNNDEIVLVVMVMICAGNQLVLIDQSCYIYLYVCQKPSGQKSPSINKSNNVCLFIYLSIFHISPYTFLSVLRNCSLFNIIRCFDLKSRNYSFFLCLCCLTLSFLELIIKCTA